MATLESISEALQLVDTKKQNLKKAYDDVLHSHSSLLSSSSFPLDWSLLDSHFSSLHNSLNQRFIRLQSLESRRNQPNPNDPSPSPSSSSDPFPQNGTFPLVKKSHAEVLCALCKSMDGKALRDYIGENLKDRVVIKARLKAALKLAPDPAAIVLDAIDGVFGGVNVVKDGGELMKMKRCCNLLSQQLRFVNPNLSGEVSKKAKTLATQWKGSLESCHGDAVGAMAFLHFVAAYRLLSELSVDELATFSAMAAANDELPELYQIIGLTDKVPALVQKLTDKGKHILAVKYIFEFNLTDEIPPVPILEAYVNESQKLARRFAEEGKSVIGITEREISALKSVIKVIEHHNLDSEFPCSRLEERIKHLKMILKAHAKHPAPAFAAKPPQHHSLQQSGIKHPRTSAPIGPAAILNNINSATPTMHLYQQPLFQSTGGLPEHLKPYMSMPATQLSMVTPDPRISPYQGPSSGPYVSHLSSSEPHVPSAYDDGYGLQRYYQTYYPQ